MEATKTAREVSSKDLHIPVPFGELPGLRFVFVTSKETMTGTVIGTSKRNDENPRLYISIPFFKNHQDRDVPLAFLEFQTESKTWLVCSSERHPEGFVYADAGDLTVFRDS